MDIVPRRIGRMILCDGALRLVGHNFFPKIYKVKEYLDWRGLAEELLPPDAQSCFDEIKKQRNMTRPCHTIAEKEVVLKHLYDGDRTAELAAKFQHFLPWSWRQGDCLADFPINKTCKLVPVPDTYLFVF